MKDVKLYLGGDIEIFNTLNFRNEVRLFTGGLFEFDKDVYAFGILRNGKTSLVNTLRDVRSVISHSKNVVIYLVGYNTTEVDNLKTLIKVDTNIDVDIFSDEREIIKWVESKIDCILNDCNTTSSSGGMTFEADSSNTEVLKEDDNIIVEKLNDSLSYRIRLKKNNLSIDLKTFSDVVYSKEDWDLVSKEITSLIAYMSYVSNKS